MSKIRVVILALVMAAVVAVTACQSGESAVPQAGKPALDFELPDLDGQPVALSGLQGRAVMVNFWATWCGPCVYEMPLFQEIYEEWSARGLVILAVNIGGSPAQVRGFMEDNGLSFTVLLDADGEVAERYRIRAIPTTIFIDKDGIIRGMKMGVFSSKAAVEEHLNQTVP